MSELGQDQLRHRQAYRVLGPGHRENHLPVRGARTRAAQDRRGADFLVAECPEQFSEAGEPLLQQAIDRFVRVIPGRDAGSARGENRLDVRVGELGSQRRAHAGRIIREYLTARDLMAVARQQILNHATAGVGCLRARVTDRQNVTSNAGRRGRSVFDVAHGAIIQGLGARG